MPVDAERRVQVGVAESVGRSVDPRYPAHSVAKVCRARCMLGRLRAGPNQPGCLRLAIPPPMDRLRAWLPLGESPSRQEELALQASARGT